MSRAIIRKQFSYSQYRSRNSASKHDLSKSFVDQGNSLVNITVQKTSQLQILQKQLGCLIKNRSLSSSSFNKNSQNGKALYKSVKNIKQINISALEKQKQNISQQPHVSNQLSSQNQKPKISILLNQTFQPILQNCMPNQQEDIFDKSQMKNCINIKVSDNIKINTKKSVNSMNNSMTKKNNSLTIKASIDQLSQMQKKLESVKQTKNLTGANLKNNKIQIKSKQPLLKRINSQNKIIKDPRGKQMMLKFQIQNRIRIKSNLSINTDNLQPLKSQRQTQCSNKQINPTNLINRQEKQILCLDLDKLKQLLKNNQIKSEYLQKIKSSINDLFKLTQQ